MHGYYTRQIYRLLKINKRLALIGLVAVIVAVVVGTLGLKLALKRSNASKIITVNKVFRFPAISRGEQREDGIDLFYEGEVEITVKEIEVAHEVLVKNQPVTAKAGKVYLIAKLDIKNDSTQKLGFMANDVVRLQIGDSKRAADLHNNLIEVAPVSTREDRVGFIIDSKLKSVKLQFGKFYETADVMQEINLNW